jgi:pimeloyl-ACP methyl ester carboxylesterase
MTASVFDEQRFNESLFFPRPASGVAPPGARDHFVDVAGATLHVREHGAAGRPVLLFHGNGEVVDDYDGAAALFAAAGLQLWVTDFRGYGLSTGAPTLRDALCDAPPVVEAVHALAKRPLVVMGRSLGGQCAAELCQAPRASVEAYVFESAATDLHALVRRRGYTDVTLSAEDLAHFDPLPKLARCTAPTLFLHGAKDELIVPAEAQRGHATVAGSQLVFVEGRGHNDLSLSASYWAALSDFAARLPSPGR